MTPEEHNIQTAHRRSILRRLAVLFVRSAFNVAVAALILAAAAVVFVQTEAGRRFLTSQVLNLVNSQINGTFTCDDVRIDVFRGVVIDRPRLTVQGKPLLDAEQIRVSYDIAALVGHTTAVNAFKLVRPTINLVRDTSGVWNFSRLSTSTDTTASAPSKLVLRLRDVAITDGTIHVDDRTSPQGPTTTFDPAHLALTNLQLNLSSLIDLGKREYTAVVEHLSFVDKRSPQMQIDHLSLAAHLGPGGAQVRALVLETPRTSIALKGEILGIDIEREGLPAEKFRSHPLRAHVIASRVWGPDVRYFLPFLDIRETYAIDSDVSFNGERVLVENMRLDAGHAALKGSVEVVGLDGRTPLFLHVQLHDSHARYAEVQDRMAFLSLPELPFIGSTYVKHIEMKGHPSDSLWFDIDGQDDLGEIRGLMTLYLNTTPMAYKLDAAVRKADLTRFDPAFGPCDLNGRVRIEGRGGVEKSEFRGGRLAEAQALRRLGHQHDGRIRLGLVPLVERRAMLGGVIGGIDDVLEADRQAEQPVISGDGARREPGAIHVESGEGEDILLALGNGFQREFEHGCRGEIPGFDSLGQIKGAHHGLVPSSLATTKRVARWAKGAAMSAAR